MCAILILWFLKYLLLLLLLLLLLNNNNNSELFHLSTIVGVILHAIIFMDYNDHIFVLLCHVILIKKLSSIWLSYFHTI